MGSKNGKPILRNEDIVVLSNASGYSKQEVESKFNTFITEHPNGKLSKKDFREMIALALPKKDVSKLDKHVFRIYDTNNDGSIDFVEFMVVFHILSDGTPEDVLLKIFRTFDVNSDGHITKNEMQRLVKDLQCLIPSDFKSNSKGLADTAFAEMDKDKDGVVSSEEFVRAVMNQEQVSKMLTMNIMNIFIEPEK